MIEQKMDLYLRQRSPLGNNELVHELVHLQIVNLCQSMENIVLNLSIWAPKLFTILVLNFEQVQYNI